MQAGAGGDGRLHRAGYRIGRGFAVCLYGQAPVCSNSVSNRSVRRNQRLTGALCSLSRFGCRESGNCGALVCYFGRAHTGFGVGRIWAGVWTDEVGGNRRRAGCRVFPIGAG